MQQQQPYPQQPSQQYMQQPQYPYMQQPQQPYPQQQQQQYMQQPQYPQQQQQQQYMQPQQPYSQQPPKKTKTCKHCKAAIAKDAKICPFCGQKQKKGKGCLKWILIVLVLFIALCVVIAKSSSPSGKTSSPVKNEEASSSQTVQESKSGQEEKTEFHVGEVYEGRSLKITYVSSGKYVSDNPYSQPSEGKQYIFLKFAAENISDSDASITDFSFHCYADGYEADSKYFMDEDELSATLSAGRSTTGSLYFEVPANAQKIEVEYEPNMLSNKKIKFLYEGDKDSGITVSANTTAAADAHHVGETFDIGDLRFSYLSAFVDTSSSYMQPKDGYHYVTCEFEVENISSSSDKTVSYFSFDCFADGIDCDGAYFRDDNLSATLSAGRKAKGTVTFEVPVSAAVVEVEYLDNIWTSNRIIFDASGAR